MTRTLLLAAAAILVVCPTEPVVAFAPPTSISTLQRFPDVSSAKTPSSSLYSTSTTSLQAGGSVIPNPFQQLPWNVEREQRRKARKLRLERSALHRKLKSLGVVTTSKAGGRVAYVEDGEA